MCFRNILLIHTIPLLMIHPSQLERVQKIFFSCNTFFFFLYIPFVSFSISNTTCLFITLRSVIASVTLLLWQLVDHVATFQAILGCEICFLSSYIRRPLYCENSVCLWGRTRRLFRITTSYAPPPQINFLYLSLSGGGRRERGGSELRGRP